MESPHDLRIESLNDERIEYYKKLSFINNEHDLHCVFNVLGRDLVIEKVAKDQIRFYLSDRIVSLDDIQDLISKDEDIAYNCLFGNGDVYYYINKESEKQIDQLIADYEVSA